jgi:hypothetical protein
MRIIVLIALTIFTVSASQAQCTSMTLSMTDSFGDGWNNASYSITNTTTGVVVASGSLDTAVAGDGASFGSDVLCLQDGCYSIYVGGGIFDSEIGWTLTNTATGTISGGAPQSLSFNVGAGCGGGGGPVGCENYTFSAFGGSFDTEISWNLYDENGALVASGFSTAGTTLCLVPGCYTVEMLDSFGDGWNGANWQLTSSTGVVQGSGTLTTGSFGSATVAVGGADCGIVDPPPGGDIVVTSGVFTPQQLITDVFLGDCLDAVNISYTGSTASIGTFTNGGGIGIDEGIILSSGNVMDATSPNASTSYSGAGSPLLDLISNAPTNDAAVFTFDFTASTSEVSFTYVFASEEYPEFVCSSFNDAFGFFVSGPGYAPNTNIATIPGTNVPVTIDNVNNDPFCTPNYPAYYNDNTAQSVFGYDGYTDPLTATITTVPCETYQITIAVGDAGDWILDSAVLLQAQSFSAGVDVAVAANNLSGIQSTPAGCDEGGTFVFANAGEPFTEDVTVTFLIGGTAQSGTDYDPIPTEITFPAGTDIMEIDVTGIIDQLPNTPETITLTMNETCSCLPPPEVSLFLCQQLFLSAEWGVFTAEWISDKQKAECLWTSLSEHNLSHYVIERSHDGILWDAIGSVQAAGATGTPAEYVYIDESPLIGRSYYRIIAVDESGVTNSSVIRTLFKEPLAEVTVYPNPGNGLFTLSGYAGQQIVLYNSLGELVQFELNAYGELDLTSCASGVYHLRLMHEDAVVQTERLVVH